MEGLSLGPRCGLAAEVRLAKVHSPGGGYNYQSAGAISIRGFNRHRASCLFSDSVSKSSSEKISQGKN